MKLLWQQLNSWAQRKLAQNLNLTFSPSKFRVQNIMTSKQNVNCYLCLQVEFHWSGHELVRLHTVQFADLKEDLSNCDRNHLAHTAKCVVVWPLEGSFLTSAKETMNTNSNPQTEITTNFFFNQVNKTNQQQTTVHDPLQQCQCHRKLILLWDANESGKTMLKPRKQECCCKPHQIDSLHQVFRNC